MDFILISWFLFLTLQCGQMSAIEGSSDCQRHCEEWPAEDIVNCYIQPGCDITFPEVAFYTSNLGFYHVELIFTEDITDEDFSEAQFEFKGRFSYQEAFNVDRYYLNISDIASLVTDKEGKLSAFFSFAINTVSPRDEGAYRINLIEDIKEGVTILQTKYLLWTSESPFPQPKCETKNVISPEVNNSFLLKCSLVGFFYPSVHVGILTDANDDHNDDGSDDGSDGGGCNVSPSHQITAGLHVVESVVVGCEVATLKCEVKQNRSSSMGGSSAAFSRSCIFTLPTNVGYATSHTAQTNQPTSSHLGPSTTDLALYIGIPSLSFCIIAVAALYLLYNRIRRADADSSHDVDSFGSDQNITTKVDTAKQEDASTRSSGKQKARVVTDEHDLYENNEDLEEKEVELQIEAGDIYCNTSVC